MGDFIEWDVVQPTLRARLMVRTIREDVPATLDDLRRGCEAVGLHVVGEDGSWKDQSIKDWSELAKRQTVWLGDVRKALDPNGISHADLESMASATVAARDLAMAAAEKAETEVATLRAQLDELRAEHKAMLASSLRELEVLRAQLAEAEARITKAEQEAGVSLDTLRWSYVDACERLGVDRGDLCTGISKVLKRAEKYCLDLGTMQTERDTARAQLAAAEALLEATRQASQCAPKSADIPKMVADIVANRKAVCEHARALEAQLAVLTSPEGRATDEDLVEIWANAFDKEQSLATHVPGSGTARLAAARAVAAKVRRERPACLVERLVAAKAKFSAFERESDATWTVHVHVCLPGTGGYTTNVTDLPSADVPATLARLAGLEVK